MNTILSRLVIRIEKDITKGLLVDPILNSI